MLCGAVGLLDLATEKSLKEIRAPTNVKSTFPTIMDKGIGGLREHTISKSKVLSCGRAVSAFSESPWGALNYQTLTDSWLSPVHLLI